MSPVSVNDTNTALLLFYMLLNTALYAQLCKVHLTWCY